MPKRTLQEIIDAPDLFVETDQFDIAGLVSLVSDDVVYPSDFDIKNDDTLGVKSHVKIDVNYDHRRGARTEVLAVDGEPFAVVTRSGRELSDRQDYYILDPNLLREAYFRYKSIEVPEERQGRPETEIDIAYWEGIEVDLGDSGPKGGLY